MEDGYLELSQILKSGTMATDIALNGVLTPKQGRAFASAIVDNSGLLKQITVDITGKLTKNRTALDVAKGILTRHIPGQGMTDEQLKKLSTIGAKLDMTNGVTLRMMITDDALDDNQDNPNFEKEQFTGATVAFSNDIVYLGWVGTADNDSPTAPFEELAKGWIQIATESTDSKKATYTPVDGDNGATVELALQKVCDTADEDITDDIAIYLNKKDYSDYVRKISKDYQAVAILKSGEFLEFEGRKLVPQKGIPQGTFMGTPEKNMILGFSKKIDRKRWYDNDRSAIQYKFVVRPDYEFDIKKYVTLVTAE